ncbi:tetratricopeptide-like helical domain-containing protein [Artemisia annua]|uniref:Tetratricopeptide-like helical domain-containing protein n=1 Tax=Artemisia annua TaxID=35608 RepID=A0A2U1LQE0_ARTAN|nr:tetratricopeptide-like helical domain-containing protein [Artemisia annua]
MRRIEEAGNEFTWSALLTGYARVGDCDEVFSLFRKMSEAGDMLVAVVKPTPITITGLLPAFGSMGSINNGKEVHEHARNMFGTVWSKNVASRNAMIGCYGKHAMVGWLTKVTFYKSMRESQWVEIREEHYGCVIGLLCRSLKIEEAPDLAKKVVATLTKMKTNKSGVFITLSNVYAGEGEWAKVEMLREVMKDGVGGSGRYEFTWSALKTRYAGVGDCEEAFRLFWKMSETGLVPDVATWNAMIYCFLES